MRNRFVKAYRERDKDINDAQYTRYVAVELRNGNLYKLHPEEYLSTVGEAFNVIDAIEAREAEPRAWKAAEARGENPFKGLK